jgi:RNA polymerase sigma factor (sigma-70 family)
MSPRVSLRLLASQSDRRLLELVERGHERAFEALVLRYRRPLLAYCTRLGLSDARAEDVVQQSLLKAWLALAGGVQVRELRAWLYRIVHNTAVNSLRSQPADGARAGLEHSRAHAPASHDEVERSLAARQALSDVAALPSMQRDAILLSAVEGRSHEEVASALGVTSTAARGLIYRARAALRSAAAALTPPWMLQWAGGGASRVAPSAARLGELYASSGGDSATGVLKGAAIAVTAALAAGAALAPLGSPQHRQARHADVAGAPRVTIAGAGAAAGTQNGAAPSGHGYLGAARVRAGSAAPSHPRSGAGGTQPATAHAYSRAPVAYHRSPASSHRAEAKEPATASPNSGPAATTSSAGAPAATSPGASVEPAPGNTGAPPPTEKPVVKEPVIEKPPEEPGDGPEHTEPGPLPPPVKPGEPEPKPDE